MDSWEMWKRKGNDHKYMAKDLVCTRCKNKLKRESNQLRTVWWGANSKWVLLLEGQLECCWWMWGSSNCKGKTRLGEIQRMWRIVRKNEQYCMEVKHGVWGEKNCDPADWQ